MGVIWDKAKERRLFTSRKIVLSEIADIVVSGKYLAVLENPARSRQMIFVVWYHDYTHVVPFVIDKNDNIVLKTASPSRKFHKLYGSTHETKT